MIFRIRAASEVEFLREMEALRARRTYSPLDRLWVVSVTCVTCGGEYKEEYEAARAMVMSNAPWTCLGCAGPEYDVPIAGLSVVDGR